LLQVHKEKFLAQNMAIMAEQYAVEILNALVQVCNCTCTCKAQVLALASVIFSLGFSLQFP
jgi:hypothetical protein